MATATPDSAQDNGKTSSRRQFTDRTIRMRKKPEDFGTRLRRVRNERRETQEVFAQRGGITPKSQANYEKGIRFPRADYLQRLAESGVDVAYLLTGVETGEKLTCEEQLMLREIRKHDISKQGPILVQMVVLFKAFRIER